LIGVLIVTAAGVLGAAQMALAQASECSVGSMPESSQSPRWEALCNGNPNTQVNYVREFNISATTYCRDNGWKQAPNANHWFTTKALSMCGNVPSGALPTCVGIVSNISDLGYNATAHNHKFKVLGLIRFGGRVNYVDLVSSSFVEESLQALGGIRIGTRRSLVAAGERPVAI
jgi:hypothetical protein